MPAKKMIFSVFLTALLLIGYTSAALADDPATRVGTITAVAKTGAAIVVNVEVVSETAQPLNPELSTGKPDPSSVMDPGATKVVEIAVGMPVKLIIDRQGSAFRFQIGVVASMTDKAHCTVRVDPASLEQTFQDPADQNNPHKVGEFLKVGTAVAIWGVTPGG